MVAERAPRSARGRPGCDWEQAFAFWAGLPNGRRTYAAVAARFGVSVRTVERRGREDGWAGRLRVINTTAAAATDARIGEAKARTVGQMLKLLEATLVAYAENVRRGQLRTAPGDLERMFRLLGQLHAELETPAVPAAGSQPTLVERPVEHTAAVVQALAECGALEPLGLQRIPSGNPSDTSDGDRADSECTDNDAAGTGDAGGDNHEAEEMD